MDGSSYSIIRFKRFVLGNSMDSLKIIMFVCVCVFFDTFACSKRSDFALGGSLFQCVRSDWRPVK